jgi:hypothetical protein
MRTRSKLLFTSLGAALLLSMAVGSASARDLSVTNRNFRAVWRELRLRSTGGVDIRCPVTLEGSFHSSTIHKTIHALGGHITRATIVSRTCSGGTVTASQESLPWHVTYEGFSGVLPTITLTFVSLIGMKFTITAAGVTCVARTTTENPGRGRLIVGGGGATRELVADETVLIPLTGFGCELAGEGFFGGAAAVTLLGNTTTISIRLI